MPRTTKIIRVPRPAPGSFNKHRPAGILLQAQLAQLRQALIKHHAGVEALLAIDLDEIETEAEVAEYARKVGALLHPHHARNPKP
ncbi:MAG TPA: hypothetical protein VGS20_16105 [Candidatus Acidoferrales bacterium]|nr:hypothetical protein [Candidatus Acidoferrales bacterium]